MEKRGDAGPIDLDKTTVTLEPEKTSSGGLYVPGKDRVVFKPPERKSLLGLDVLAIAKRGGSETDGAFKVPRERVASVVASIDEDEKSASSGVVDDVESNAISGAHSHASRRYREMAVNESSLTESNLTQENDTFGARSSKENIRSKASSSGNSRSARSRSPMRERDDRGRDRRYYEDGNRGESRRERQSYSNDRKEKNRRGEAHGLYEQEYSGEYGRKRSRYESSRRSPGRSDWDDERWEWEDTPHRDGCSSIDRRHQPSPSPMFVGASPDARLVSPWLGGQTPRSARSAASPWDNISPSPVPIRASGSSVQSSSSTRVLKLGRYTTVTADSYRWR